MNMILIGWLALTGSLAHATPELEESLQQAAARMPRRPAPSPAWDEAQSKAEVCSRLLSQSRFGEFLPILDDVLASTNSRNYFLDLLEREAEEALWTRQMLEELDQALDPVLGSVRPGVDKDRALRLHFRIVDVRLAMDEVNGSMNWLLDLAETRKETLGPEGVRRIRVLEDRLHGKKGYRAPRESITKKEKAIMKKAGAR